MRPTKLRKLSAAASSRDAAWKAPWAAFIILFARARGGPFEEPLLEKTSRRVALPAAGVPDDVLALQPLAGLAVARWITVLVLAVHQQAGGRARPVSMVLVALAWLAALNLHGVYDYRGRGAKER
jgi:hypothetical protein